MITDLMAARSQMAISLSFHIVFAAIGMAMPFLMAIAHWRWLRGGDAAYLQLTRAWSKGVAIFFAVGAVSGTALSFELGLLWPRFMAVAGPVIGLPFAWEGAAFFLEAIALAIFLYGWNRVPRWVHWISGVLVGVFGMLSACFVITANGWMNAPRGFDWINGHAENIRPYAAMFNPAAGWQAVHMMLAALAATGFAVAGVHALGRLLNPRSALHVHAYRVALLVGSVGALLLPLTGDLLGKRIAILQPAKLAAMEAHFVTASHAALILGGIPDEERRQVRFGVELPGLLSWLAHGDTSATVQGLDAFPRADWPPVPVVHAAFDLMVGCGSLLALVGAVALLGLWRGWPLLERRGFLRLIVSVSPLGFIALEAGWAVTEVGRQPWIIYGLLRTADAVTPMPGLAVPLTIFSALYLALAFIVVWLMIRQFRHVE